MNIILNIGNYTSAAGDENYILSDHYPPATCANPLALCLKWCERDYSSICDGKHYDLCIAVDKAFKLRDRGSVELG